MTKHDLGTYQMLWDCPFCGTDKLLGLDHRHCPSCGAAQDEESRYFPAEADRIAVADHRYHGADLDCPSCSTPNAALAVHCVNCGSALQDAETVRTVDAAPKPKSGRRRKAAKSKGSFGVGTLLIAGFLLFAAYIVVNTCTSEELSVLVEGRAWERAVQIEQLAEVERGAWCDAVPSGAVSTTRTPKVRSQEQVPDGETCAQKQRDNGDGTFTAYEDCQPRFKTVDVQGEWCAWTGTEWFVVRTERASGASDPLVWPDARIVRPGDCVGCERVGAKTGTYTVHLRGGSDEAFSCDVTEARWGALAVGSRWTGEASGLSHSLRCDTLTPAP